jgi:hypothetical protein
MVSYRQGVGRQVAINVNVRTKFAYASSQIPPTRVRARHPFSGVGLGRGGQGGQGEGDTEEPGRPGHRAVGSRAPSPQPSPNRVLQSQSSDHAELFHMATGNVKNVDH